MRKFFKHIALVTRHRYKVFKLCTKCGLFWRGLVHDLSKFSPTEFWESVKYYNGEKSPISLSRKQNGFSKCWLHHKGRNKHHLEYWYDDVCKVPPMIPYKYLVECACDKISASKCYNRKNFTSDMPLQHWQKNWDYYKSNEKVKEFLTKVFEDYKNLGEKAVINKKYMKKTYHEICEG